MDCLKKDQLNPEDSAKKAIETFIFFSQFFEI